MILIIQLLWTLTVLFESGAHAWLIEKRNVNINHALAAGVRVLGGLTFAAWAAHLGLHPFVALPFMFTYHILIFPEMLNAFRSKPLGYRSTSNWWDTLSLKLFPSPIGWLVIRVALAFLATGFAVNFEDRWEVVSW